MSVLRWVATLLAALPLGVAADAATTLTASPVALHPNVAVTFTGAGFGASEAVDIYIDTADTQLQVSSSSGALTGSITIPLSAQPGMHYITAVGRRTGDAAQAALTVTTSWTQQGAGTAHLNFNPYENTLGTDNVGSIGVLWSKSIGATGGTIAKVGSHLYLGTNTGVTALSATNGATVWTSTLNETFYGSPSVPGSSLYIGSNSGNLYALNASTGAVKWKTAIGGGLYGSPTYVNGTIYIGSSTGIFYAVAASTGKILWSYTTGGVIYNTAAYFNGQIFFGSGDDKIYALNATTGAVVWTYATSGVAESAPAVASGIVYVGSDGGSVYALGAADGTLIWSFATGGGAVYDDPAVAKGIVYVGSANGTFYALNARNGSVVWSLADTSLPRTAAVANGVVYFNGDLFTAASASSGGVLATGKLGNTYLGGPSVSDGAVYVSSISYGTVYALAANAGNAESAARARAKLSAKRPAPAISSLHPDMTLRVMR